MRTKRLVVIFLSWLCSQVDNGRPFCRCTLATWSDQLDQRWGTGVWIKPSGQ